MGEIDFEVVEAAPWMVRLVAVLAGIDCVYSCGFVCAGCVEYA